MAHGVGDYGGKVGRPSKKTKQAAIKAHRRGMRGSPVVPKQKFRKGGY